MSSERAESIIRTASDGYPLHIRHWKPGGPPRGYVIALHGIQSHAGWYEYSSQRFQEAGYDVQFMDRRGSGQNETDRGHAAHPDRLVNDVTQLLGETQFVRDRENPEAPIILLGVSWGGKLATVIAARRPNLLDGLALLYPGLKARVKPRWHQRQLLKLGMGLGAARKLVEIPLGDPALFTGEAEWQQFIADDSLSLHEATVSFLQTSVLLDAEVDRIISQLKTPTLLMLAGRDQIIDNPATKRLMMSASVPHLLTRVYPAAQHTLEFEPNRKQIFSEVILWFEMIRSMRESRSRDSTD